MLATLYEPFRHWSEGGSVCILSDLHFDDWDCKLMDPDWVTPKEQIAIINKHVMKNDTFICLGDVGKPDYMKEIRANKKILILGNHDARGRYEKYFDEIYAGPVFIEEKILLSHEPVYGLGNLQRLSNALDAMTGKMADVKQKLANVEHQLETAKVEVTKPFP